MTSIKTRRLVFIKLLQQCLCVEAKDLINVTVQDAGISAALTNASASRQIISVIADAIHALVVVINRLYKTYLGAQD